MITIWKTPIVATVEQVLKDLKLQLYGAGLLKEIKNTGSDLMCTCPFHANGKEHNPSCGVLLQQKVTKDKTYEAGTVHCYTCGYTADLPQFVADLLGLSILRRDSMAGTGDNMKNDHQYAEVLEMMRSQGAKDNPTLAQIGVMQVM